MGRRAGNPLERFLPAALWGGFMYMHATTLEGGGVVHAYKHSGTRRYLLLDDSCDSWENIDHGRYRRMRHEDAIEHLFPAGWLLEQATEKDRAAVREALQAVWKGDNGDEGAGAHILPSSPACALRWLPLGRGG